MEAFRSNKVMVEVNVCTNGVDALRKRGQYANTPRLDLVLLDLKMPQKGGFETLRKMKADVSFHTILG